MDILMDVAYEYHHQQIPAVTRQGVFDSAVNTPTTPNTIQRVKKADVCTQTNLSVDNLVRQVLISKVVDGLQNRGLQVVACAHTRGLHVSDIINDIVQSHSVTCAQRSQQVVPLEGDWLEKMFEPVYPIRRPNLNSQVKKKKSKKPKGVKGVKKIPPADKSDRKCPICGKLFKYPVLAKEHMVLHTSDRPFQCDKCDFKAKTKRTLFKHNRFLHENRYPYFCKFCCKGMRTRPKLIEHETSHLDEKDYPEKCTYCEKRFTCKYNLKCHLRIHEKERLLKCDLCPESFAVPATLYDHLKKMHGAVKSFRHGMTCLICDSDFKEWPALLKHMKETHGGETFNKSVRLTCEFCSSTLACQSSKAKHMKKCHKLICNQTCKKCLLCDVTFNKTDALVEHMATHHKEYVTPKDGTAKENIAEKQRYTVEDSDENKQRHKYSDGTKKRRYIVGDKPTKGARFLCVRCNIYVDGWINFRKHAIHEHGKLLQNAANEKGMNADVPKSDGTQGCKIQLDTNKAVNMGNQTFYYSVSSKDSLNAKRTSQPEPIPQRDEKRQKLVGQNELTAEASTKIQLIGNAVAQVTQSGVHLIPRKDKPTTQSTGIQSISIVSTKGALDEIKKSVQTRKCWLCGMQATEFSDFFKHISEEHKGHLAPKSVRKDQTSSQLSSAQSSLEIDRIKNQSSGLTEQTRNQKDQTNSQTEQTSNQLSSQEDQSTSQLSAEKDQKSNQSSAVIDQAGSRSSPLIDPTASESPIKKDLAAGQSASQIHTPTSQLPNQTDHTKPPVQATDQSSLVQKDNTFLKSLPEPHHSKVEIPCDLCHKMFLASELKQHLEDSHGAHNSTACSKCLVCNVEFKDWHALVEHIRTKHKEHTAGQIRKAVAVNKCWLCQVELTESTLLVDHMKQCHNIVLHVHVSGNNS